jgi:hypothetical protein
VEGEPERGWGMGEAWVLPDVAGDEAWVGTVASWVVMPDRWTPRGCL